MKLCKTCGFELSDDAVFCTNCGTVLRDAEKETDILDDAWDAEKTTVLGIGGLSDAEGTVVLDESEGTDVLSENVSPTVFPPENEPPRRQKEQPPKKQKEYSTAKNKRALNIIIILLCVLLIVTVVLVILLNKGTPPDPAEGNTSVTESSAIDTTEASGDAEMEITGKRTAFTAKMINDIFAKNAALERIVFSDETLDRKAFYQDSTVLDSLISSGSQYIDTGFKPTENTTFEAKFSTEESKTDTNLFGSRISNGNQDLTVWINTSAKKGIALHRMSAEDIDTKWVYTDNITDGAVKLMYKIDAASNASDGVYKIFVDGREVYEDTTQKASVVSKHNAYLFGYNNDGTATGLGKFRLYYFKIYDNGTPVRDYIPVLDCDGNPCLYDSVENVYYYNRGIGEFTYTE